MSTPLPDRNLDFTLRHTFVVAATKTVRPGLNVKITGFQSGSTEIIEVEEAILVTDLAIGTAWGALGANGPGALAAGAEVHVVLHGHAIDWMIAGTAGATMGQCVVQGTAGVVTAPTQAAAGTVVYESPGIALTSGTLGQAVAVLIRPSIVLA